MVETEARMEYKKQWRTYNAEHIKEQSKEYYENNRDIILEKKRYIEKNIKRRYKRKSKNMLHVMYVVQVFVDGDWCDINVHANVKE